MGKLNIAELLKDCPTGMELDCTCADNVVFDKIIEYDQIQCVIGECREPLILDKYGRLLLCCPKCVIFPKGKTTWEGFQRPFKDGDMVFYDDNIAIFKEWGDETLFRTYVKLYVHKISIDIDFPLFGKSIRREARLATEEEKQKLLKAIKDNGYRWNAETKTLEKLIIPKFKVGDRVKHISAYVSGIVVKVNDKGYHIDYPKGEGVCYISFELEKDYELAPNKFDITTLKPFESRVLVRTDNRKWVAAFYSHYDKDSILHHCVVGGLWYKQCIPYKGNEHLLDTTNDCDEYFKTWK